MIRRLLSSEAVGVWLALCVSGCDEDGGESSAQAGQAQSLECGALVEAEDLAACSPNAHDYQPAGQDAYPACVTDDGTYALVADTPSSIARVEAYEDVLQLLGPAPTPDDFTAARAKYSEDEGLESRLQRREDLHMPPIPESDWDPGVDRDKQCTVAANVTAYPERCAGPALIAPIVNAAFADGQRGDGQGAVHAARIEASCLWFLYLSVYKEANTCFTSKAKDCDSAWAYYTGGFDRAGGIGLAADILAVDPPVHEAIWDGFSAFRCIRDLYPADETPEVSDLDLEGQELLCAAQSQLTTALDAGLARVVSARLRQQVALQGVEADANWAFLQVLGPVLDRGGAERDDAAYAPARDLWGQDAPTADEVTAALEAIDTVFSCA